MDDQNDVNYNSINTPFIIRSDSLNLWPCFGWTLKDWGENCNETKFAFRVHKKTCDQFWENQAIDRFETLLSNYEEWTQLDANNCSLNNPFNKYPKNDYWVYSSYNYIDKMFSHNKRIMQSVNWSQLGLDPKLDTNAKNSTLWIGSEGAFTPCHQDSYGYNFVAQLSGTKQWILFPPSDQPFLYPTRIPYEESSVFSSVNFHNPNYSLHPLFTQTKPYIVELKAGDILFVPHLWWHFVRVVGEDADKSCISINTWISNDCFESSLNESVVRFLTTALFKTYCPTQPSKWLNTNADLFTPEEAVCMIGLIVKQCNSSTQSLQTNTSDNAVLPKNACLIESSTFEDFRKLFNENIYKKSKLDQQIGDQKLNVESIVNCILDPEVVELIAKKLLNISLNK